MIVYRADSATSGKPKIVISLIVLMTLLLGVSCQAIIPEPEIIKEVEVITEYVKVPVYINRVEDVDRVEYVEKIVEVVKEVPIKLENWESVEELKEFLDQDNPDIKILLIANEDGVVAFVDQCEDWAFQLIARAAEKGKRLIFVTINKGQYYQYYKKPLSEGKVHALVGALVGDNELWYIEPTDDRHWLAFYLD